MSPEQWEAAPVKGMNVYSMAKVKQNFAISVDDFILVDGIKNRVVWLEKGNRLFISWE